MSQKLKKENYLQLVGLMNLFLSVFYTIRTAPTVLNGNSISVGFYGLLLFIIPCLQYLFMVLILSLGFKIWGLLFSSERNSIRPFKLAFNFWIVVYSLTMIGWISIPFV